MMLVENSSHQLARPSMIILFQRTIATSSAATSSQCNCLLVFVRIIVRVPFAVCVYDDETAGSLSLLLSCASWRTNTAMTDTMTDKLYFDVKMPTGAVVRIPLSTVTSFTAIRGYLQDNHRDKYGDMYVHDLTLYHSKHGAIKLCYLIKDLFVDADFPVQLVAKPQPVELGPSSQFICYCCPCSNHTNRSSANLHNKCVPMVVAQSWNC